MTVTDTELLRRYTDQKSDDAFAELVARHLDLVHSAALRQVNGDAADAADVAQAVFTDLARKARQLTRHTSLTGWLYTSTRFLAANTRRTESRRRSREQQAHAMNQLLQPDIPDPEWDQLQPVLDETMHELDQPDREAVLWRYFERRSHAEIGSRLGLSENAARMRVDRALDKLRAGLANRGIHSTAAVLGGVLGQKSVAAAPPGMAGEISRIALAGSASAIVAPSAAGFFRRWRVPIALAALTLLVLIPAGLLRSAKEAGAIDGRQGGISALGAASDATSRSRAEFVANTGDATADTPDGTTSKDATATNVLVLTVLAAESGKPLANVPINQRGWEGERFVGKRLVTLRDGTCRVPFSTNSAELELTTQADGFADTRLVWSPKRGEIIPATYTVKLRRPVKLGGRVVDADGQPVAGAKVGFNHEEEPALVRRPESYEFGWIEVVTDDAGHWEINRIAEEMVRRIYGGARYAELVDSPPVWVGKDAQAEQELRKGTHVFKLGRAAEITGVVVDSEGNPISSAKAALGNVGNSGRREAIADAQGAFTLRGCALGKGLLSAQALGFAATTEEVSISTNSPPFRLVLKAGAELRLRIVNHDGQPVPKAHAWLNTLERGPIDPDHPKPPIIQADVDLRSDEEGRVVWSEAPDANLEFDLSAKGYMRVSNYKIRPDGQEHTVILPPSLTIFGTVQNADTGKPVPKFRVITGWPRIDFGPSGAITNADWSTLDRFWMTFARGEFHHSFDEAVIGGMANPGYILKFEAEGYASFVSRTIAADEGKVRLDVVLNPASESTITVLSPEGSPVRQAEVALLTAGSTATFDGRAFEPDSSPGMIRIMTDAQGQFRLPGDDTIIRILIAHASGFLDVRPPQFHGESPWTLQPWGQIEGTWLAGDQPVAGRELLVQATEGLTGMLQFDFTRYRLATDAAGRFQCDRVPPGRVKLVRLTRQEQGGGRTSWRHGKAVEVEIKPGEVTSVMLGGAGYTASLRLAWPTGSPGKTGGRVFGGIHTPPPAGMSELVSNPEALARFQQTPEFQAFVKTARQFEFLIRNDVATAEEVEPGEYEATVVVLGEAEKGVPPGPIFSGRTRVSIPAEPGSGRLDLGEIVLEATSAPVGQ
ncbi:MAG TPA: sigma-70 family RNA polymerase sigma factor [Verrucomicrobiota bacterium]|nr:hypothetical protein [Verrucomicrobiales bacterium]HRI11539.1 sigma-70 family RNA polymerase sigma factor [Verrucomicrobiota bacterium]